MVDHLFHEEINEAVKKLAPSSSEWIGVWQSTLTGIIDKLETEGRLSEYQLTAERWNKTGPPKELQLA